MPQNFCLGFIDKLEKQLIIKKKLLKWANKNVRILIFTMLKKNNKKDKEEYLEISSQVWLIM